MRILPFLRSAALVAISILVLLVVLEGGFRLFGPGRPTPPATGLSFAKPADIAGRGVFEDDPELGIRIKYASDDPAVVFDSWGRPYAKAKPADTFRIVCLGGSTTFGTGSGPGETYPAWLQRLFDIALAGCSRRVEVINCAMMAYTSYQSLIRASSELRDLDPDLYLVMDGLNDVVSAMGISQAFVDKKNTLLALVNTQPSLFQQGVRRLDALCGHLTFYGYLKTRLFELRHDPADATAVAKRIEAFGYRDNMALLAKSCRESNARLAIVNYPWIVQDADYAQARQRIPYHLDKNYFRYFTVGKQYITRTNASLEKQGQALFIDPQPMLDALTATGNLYRYYSDIVHFTRYSNYLIARAVYLGLTASEPLRTRLADCALPAVNDLDAGLFAEAFLHEHFVKGCVYPQEDQPPVPLTIVATANIADIASDDGWSWFTVQDRDRPGVVTVTLRPAAGDPETTGTGFNALCYPRFRFADDALAIVRPGGEAVARFQKPARPPTGRPWRTSTAWPCRLRRRPGRPATSF